MNDTVKDILSEKLTSAKKREGLDNSEVARILGLKSKHYTGKICSKSPNQRGDVPVEAWRQVQAWTNSGLSLRQYGEKMGTIDKAKETIEQTMEEVNITSEDLEPIDMTKKTLEAKAIPEDPAKGKFRVEMQIVDKPKIQDIPLDRLKILFDVIHELKALGYRVDINIYEKEGK